MTQVFVSGIPGYSTLTFNNEFKTIFDVKVALKERLSFLENTDFQLLKQSQYMKEDDEIKTNSHPLELSFRVPCLGGKGAFGSKLKSKF
jgi:hypothetical protein